MGAKQTKISDEIRRRFDDSPEVEYVIFDRGGCDKMRELADRIDAEMMELPKDADGCVVPLDTKELYDANGKKVNVKSFTFKCDANGCWRYWKAFSLDIRNADGMFYVDGLYLTPPADSLESIANDIEESGGLFISEKMLDGWANRIRKLAKEAQ